jgi:signal peptidase I
MHGQSAHKTGFIAGEDHEKALPVALRSRPAVRRSVERGETMRRTPPLLHGSDPRPLARALRGRALGVFPGWALSVPLGLALSATLALAGCGGSGGATSTSGSTTALAGAPASGAAAAGATPGATTTATSTAGTASASGSVSPHSAGSAGAQQAASSGSGASANHAGSGASGASGQKGQAAPKPSPGSGGHAGGHSTGAGAPSTGGGSSGSPPGANSESGVPYRVSTTSMEPNYKPFTTVYYDPTRTHPQLGDVVLFRLPKGATEGACRSVEVGGAACVEPASTELTTTISMKRVVGLPGDTIAMRDGQAIRNGQPVSETIKGCTGPGCEFPKAITVPAGGYYVMSDNRQLFQEDSRVFGAVPQAAILGTVQG